LSWRTVTDFAKRKQWPLRVADVLGRGRGRWRVLDQMNRPPLAPHKPDLAVWANHDLAAAWIGHATVLLRLGGMTFLTDPVFANRVGLGFGLITGGPRRLVRPALTLRELPTIDAVLLSHSHFDHLDRPTLARLSKRTPIVTSSRMRDLVADLGFTTINELDWGQSLRLGEVTITGQPVRHWGARTFYDTHRGYGAFLLETSKQRVLFGADSAYHTEWKGLPKVDLAILGIGAYDPYVAAHATPEQALAMADHVRAEHILPMHHSTFRLSHEPASEPIERLLTAVGRDQDRVIVRAVGGHWHR
jgi:L-ascorbate metabolism protein UlaG (beta-lactamase superfamily)